MSGHKRSFKRPLLVVEDDPGLQTQLKWCFPEHQVVIAGDRAEALDALERVQPWVVTLDLGLPPDPANASEGLATLHDILVAAPHTKVIVVTGNDERANAVRAVAQGAYDYYQKPLDPELLGMIVERAFRLRELEEENRALGRQQQHSPLEGVIGASPEMMGACSMVEKVAPTAVSVLLLGESGTGKELLARAVHRLSPRRRKRFVVINCAAIPENLLESELFGYEKGAFTGAYRQTIGKIEYADGGTLFLDEIGDLPQSLQAKMLRFLQERTIERIGGRAQIQVDVRVVSATHQDLRQLIASGGFREDLYYRIAEVTVNIPPLREREGDALILARAFLERYAHAQGRTRAAFTEDAVAAIEHYAWPGNARELENRVKRAVIMAEGHRVDAKALDLPQPSAPPEPVDLRQVREEAERRAVRIALRRAEGRIALASDMLGVSRPTLYGLMEKYGIK